jgi:hypothetical protein
MRSLTSINLSNNSIVSESVQIYPGPNQNLKKGEMVEYQGEMCPVSKFSTDLPSRHHNRVAPSGYWVYMIHGIMALFDAIKENGVFTGLDLSQNNLQPAVEGFSFIQVLTFQISYDEALKHW